MGGRKKDFWDLHLLLDRFSLEEMTAFHASRYPWTHSAEELAEHFTDFTTADEDPDPVCLRGLIWDDIKLDLIDTAGNFITKIQALYRKLSPRNSTRVQRWSIRSRERWS